MLAALLPILGSIGAQVAQNLFPSEEQKAQRLRIENEITIAVMQQASAIERAAADIVLAEAQGESWIQRNWRPILMLTFGGLIVARWLGWAAPNLDADEYLKLWDIVEFGLGGYVIGRSAEKILPAVAEAMKKR